MRLLPLRPPAAAARVRCSRLLAPRSLRSNCSLSPGPRPALEGVSLPHGLCCTAALGSRAGHSSAPRVAALDA
eukprot:15449235-Alexandrium_andersonii.AAC.1